VAFTFTALAPIFLVIALGIGARRWPVNSETFWSGAERLTYFVLFPALLVARLSANPIPTAGVVPAIAALIGPVLVLSALLPLAMPLLRMSGADFATFLMASIRFNTYAGLAASVALFGARGLAVFAILLAIYIPIVNVISCLALGRWASPAATTPRYLMLAIVTNPLVLACALGIGLNLAGIVLPAAASGTLDIMGKAALGLGLLCVGASLRWRSLVESRWPIGGAALVKLVGLPLLAGLACHVLGVGGVERSVVVLFAALPASPAAYVLARQMGGNAEMMAGIITATTPLAMVTIPVALALLA
jgi:hypothetical protein